MQISLPNEIADTALAIATLRGYNNVADYIAELVMRENKADLTNPKNGQRSDQNSPQWRSQLREWAASYPETDHFVDTSRESIYGDRGI